jgi:hypothetical protein
MYTSTYNQGNTKEVTMGYGTSVVADMMSDCMKVQIITDAIELLEDGFPLDEETITALGSIGVDYNEFIKRFEIKE